MIHILDHQSDTIVDFYSNKKKIFWDDIHFSSLENYQEYFDFKTLYDNSENIQQRNRVIIPGEDGDYREFIITETLKSENSKEVFTLASFVDDLKKQKTIKPQSFQGETVNSFLDKILDGTGWKRGKTDYLGIRSIIIENPTYPFNVLKTGASTFEGELNFRIETEGSRVKGRYVDLVERQGSWNGKEITVGKDLIGVTRRETSENIITALICYGPEREDGTRLEVMVTDEDARKRWGRPANDPQHLWAIYEPQSTDQDMTKEQLTSLGKTELAKRINSVVEYEADQASIEHIFGFDHEKVRKGDTVRIKDTSYTPALYLEARVKSVERSISDKSQKKYILGDFIEYDEEDVMALFRSMQKVLSKKISEQQLLEVTYDKNTIDNKDSTVKNDAAQDATNKANQALGDAKLDAQQKAKTAQTAAEEYALAQAEAERIKAETYADGIVDDEEKARIEQAAANLATAKQHAETKANEAEEAAEAYTRSQLTNYVDTTLYDNNLAEIQAQIDNQITSHFKDYEPTLLNEPASLWTTNAEKDKHIGDLFYNSITGYSYRFMLGGTVYKWVLVRDEGIAKALQDAAQAQDTADSKRRVFVSQPTTPYDAGDLWDNNGAVYRSIVTKTSSATFSSADWYLIGDVTGENTANDTANVGGRPASDIEDKQGAQDKADSAEQSAKDYSVAKAIYEAKVLELTQDIADKAGLTYVDGQLVLKADDSRVDTIDTTVSDLQTTATNLQIAVTDNADALTSQGGRITTVETNLDTVEGNLSLAITDLSTLDNTVSQQRTDINANSTAIGLKASQDALDTVSGNVSSLSGSLDVLAGEVALKAESGVVKDLRSDFDNLEIGGRNLLRNSESLFHGLGENSLSIGTSGVNAGIYTISFDYEISSNGGNPSSFLLYTDRSIARVPLKKEGESRTKLTFEVEELDANKTIRIYFGSGSAESRANEGTFFELKLEKGNKATDWTPAPEDVQEEISTVQSNVSELVVNVDGISGNVSSLTKTVNGQGTEISDLSSNYTQLAGLVESKVDSTVYQTDKDGIIEQLNSQSTLISQNKSAIGLKADDSRVDTIAGTVDDHSAQFTVMSGEINEKAESTVVNALGTRVTTAEQNISSLDGAISSKVESTTFDALEGRVDTAESTIVQQSNEIDLKVNEDGVIAAINVSPETILLDADRIEFAGHVFGTDATFAGVVEGAIIKGSTIISEDPTSGHSLTLNQSTIEAYGIGGYNSGVGDIWYKSYFGADQISMFNETEGGFASLGPNSLFVEDAHDNYTSLTSSGIHSNGKIVLYKSGSTLELQALTDFATGYIEFTDPTGRRGYFGYGSTGNKNLTLLNQSGNNIVIDSGSAAIEAYSRVDVSSGMRIMRSRSDQSRWSINHLNNGLEIMPSGTGWSNVSTLFLNRSGALTQVEGNLAVVGSKSALVKTENYGDRLMYALETPDNRFVSYSEYLLEEGEHFIEIEPMFLETISDYFVVPHIQNSADVMILERYEDKFRVWVHGHTAEVVFEVNGKRKGFEDKYMEELLPSIERQEDVA